MELHLLNRRPFGSACSSVAAVLTLVCLAMCSCVTSGAGLSSPPATTLCSAWPANSVQQVIVDGFAHFGPVEGCRAELINVSITFFVTPQSTIVLDGWLMQHGGFVSIQGPPSAPWSVSDVAVIVKNSVIEAVDGPAVSVMLGAGYDAVDTAVTLRNVSLYCTHSRLWSSGSAAMVLSMTFSTAHAAASPNVTIDGFSAVALDSDLRSTTSASAAAGNMLAAVASVAASQHYGPGRGSQPAAWVTVSNTVLYVLRCNATAEAVGTSAATAVAGVAAVAFGRLQSAGLMLRSVTAAVVNSTVISHAASNSTGSAAVVASSIAGVAIGTASSSAPVAAFNSSLYVAWCSVTCSSAAGSDGDSTFRAASSVAGVAVGVALSSSPVTITNSTLFVGWSDVTGRSSSTARDGSGDAYAVSTVGGVAVGYLYGSSFITIAQGAILFVGWSRVASSSASTCLRSVDSSNAGSASSIGGVAVGIASTASPLAASRAQLFVWRCGNVTSTSVSTTDDSAYAYAASSVAGVAVGVVNVSSPMTLANVTFCVAWCNASSITVANSTGSQNHNADAYGASTVAGVAAGYAYSSSPISAGMNTTLQLGWCNAASTAISTRSGTIASNSYAHAGSSVAGIALGIGILSSGVWSAHSTNFAVGWSNVSSACVSTTVSDDNAYGASTVAGVAVGVAYASSPVTIASTTFSLSWSRVVSNTTSTCRGCSRANTAANGASSAAGVAVGLAQTSRVAISDSSIFTATWCDATSYTQNEGASTKANSYAYAGSSVVGVAVGVAYTSSPVAMRNTTLFVGWSNASSGCSSSSFNFPVYCASSVAGVAVAYAYTSAIAISNETTHAVAWSNATSISAGTSSGTTSYAYSGSSVAGIAVGVAYTSSSVTIADTTLFIGWTNVSSSSRSSASLPAYAASSTGGITVAYAFSQSPVIVHSSVRLHLGWCNATSSSVTVRANTAASHTYASSSVAGVAVGSTDIAPLAAAQNVTAHAFASACVTAESVGSRYGAASCLLAGAGTTLVNFGVPFCCYAAVPDDAPFAAFVPPQSQQLVIGTPLPPFDVPFLPPPPFLLNGEPRNTTATPSSGHRPTSRRATVTTASPSVTLRRGTASIVMSSPTLEHSGTQQTLAAALAPRTPHQTTAGPTTAPRLGIDPAVPEVVVAIGYGSSVVASALSPTNGNKGTVAARLVTGATCSVLGGRDASSASSVPEPNSFSLMPGVNGVASVSKAASMVLTTLILAVATTALNVIITPCLLRR